MQSSRRSPAPAELAAGTRLKPGAGIEPKSILFSLVISLFLSPLAFQLLATNTDTSTSLLSDLSATLITLAICFALILLANGILRNTNCHLHLEQMNGRRKPITLFGAVFSSPRNKQQHYDDNNNHQQQSGGRVLRDAKSSPNKRGIDSRYFKPRFILNELVSMWDTTYTVITWGSVWVVGGTIIAGGKLAERIKTKCTKEQSQQHPNASSRRRQSSYDSYASGNDDNDESADAESNTNKSSFKRLSSWTRKSYASAKKKWTKFINAGALQITTGSPRR